MAEQEFTWKGFKWRIGHPWGITHPQKENSWFGPDAVDFVYDNALSLGININPMSFDGIIKPYSVGLVSAVERMTYGTYEWRAKLPIGSNLWPALWCCACDSWPPEIDMVEGYTYRGNNDYIKNIFTTYLESNVHYRVKDNVRDSVKPKGIPTLIYKLFRHRNGIDTYKFVWTENYIKFYFNGILFRTVKDKQVLDDLNKNPYIYPIMNLEINNKFVTSDLYNIMPFIIFDFKYKKLYGKYDAGEY